MYDKIHYKLKKKKKRNLTPNTKEKIHPGNLKPTLHF